jgi:DNA mismatch endonuclease, patch repair protein
MPDNLTPGQRSYCMSRVKGKYTSLEKKVFGALKKNGIAFVRHSKSLPGKPDIVLPKNKVAIFIDGDFWHGWQFSRWEKSLSGFWRRKIQLNRCRDLRNCRLLRKSGWRVKRIWGHQLKHDFSGAIKKIIDLSIP